MTRQFYFTPTPDILLSQGDIFRNLPVPLVSLDPPYQLALEGDDYYRGELAAADFQEGTLVLATLEFKTAIVLSQSCDTLRAGRIMLAPLQDFAAGGKEKEQWKQISHLATSLNEPTRIYLPDEPSLGFPRWIIDLGGVFTFSREEMEMFIEQGKRVGGLGNEALRYLQFRLAVMFSRVARDDYYWPSTADLEMKKRVWEEKKDALSKKITQKKKEYENTTDEKRKAKLPTEIEDEEADLQETVTELALIDQGLLDRQPLESPTPPDHVTRSEPTESQVFPQHVMHEPNDVAEIPVANHMPETHYPPLPTEPMTPPEENS